MRHRVKAAVAAAMIAQLVASCASGQSGAELPDQFAPLSSVTAGIGGLPADEPGHPRSFSSAQWVVLEGAEFIWGHYAQSQGEAARLLSNTIVRYKFGGTPASSARRLELELSGLEPGETAWVGLSDYAAGRWQYFSTQSNGTLGLDLETVPGRYFSPAGNLYVVAFGAAAQEYLLHQLRLHMAAGFSISGTVLDAAGQPLSGAIVSSTLGETSVATAADGSYVLSGFSAGDWELLVTKPGFVFFSNPTSVHIDFADATAIGFTGYHDNGHWGSQDINEPNNSLAQSSGTYTSADTLEATIHFASDPDDWYVFNLSEAGDYVFRMDNPEHNILFPYLELRSPNGLIVATSRTYVFRGRQTLSFHADEAQQLCLRVSCSGDGGAYSLTLEKLLGPLNSAQGQLLENGGSINGVLIDVTAGSGVQRIVQSGSGGWLRVYDMEPELQNFSPSISGYSITPPSRQLDLGAGPQSGIDFDCSFNGASVDFAEPNDTLESAYALGNSFPLELPQTAGIGGNKVLGYDLHDWYSFDAPPGAYVRVLVESDAQPGEFAGYLALGQEDSGNAGSIDPDTPGLCRGVRQAGWDYRFGPVSAGPYYIQLSKPSSRYLAYSLRVELLDGSLLSYRIENGESLIDSLWSGADVVAYAGAFSSRFDLTPFGGPQPGHALPVSAGELINAELLFPGLSALDGLTRSTAIGAASVEELFSLDAAP